MQIEDRPKKGIIRLTPQGETPVTTNIQSKFKLASPYKAAYLLTDSCLVVLNPRSYRDTVFKDLENIKAFLLSDKKEQPERDLRVNPNFMIQRYRNMLRNRDQTIK
jgi:hypothetical protein